MKPVHAECEIINGNDLALFRRNYLFQNDVRKMQIRMCVNPKIKRLVINEIIRQQLQLQIVEVKTFRMEDDSLAQFPISSPVELRFKNRRTTCCAVVLPADGEPILGSMAFADMDVVADFEKGELAVNPEHPDMALTKLK